MQPNEENCFDTPTIQECTPCLAGCPPAENAPNRCLTIPNMMNPGLAV